MDEITVVIADDDPLVRRLLTEYVENSPDMRVIGVAGDGHEAVATASALRPDVVLMDLHMPVLDGEEATRLLTADFPDIRVIAITTFGTLDSVLPMLTAGACSYLLKDAPARAILDAVRLARNGTATLSPAIVDALVGEIRSAGIPALRRLPQDQVLTERELAVITHLATGRTNSEIARAMYVSEGTVKAHLSNVMLKWHARDRVQVLLHAARHGLVDLA